MLALSKAARRRPASAPPIVHESGPRLRCVCRERRWGAGGRRVQPGREACAATRRATVPALRLHWPIPGRRCSNTNSCSRPLLYSREGCVCSAVLTRVRVRHPLCTYESSKRHVTFSGARSPLRVLRASGKRRLQQPPGAPGYSSTAKRLCGRCLFYRAHGGGLKHDLWNDEVGELKMLRKRGNAAVAFKDVTPEDLAEGARAVQRVTPDKIKALVNRYLSGERARETIARLIARRAKILGAGFLPASQQESVIDASHEEAMKVVVDNHKAEVDSLLRGGPAERKGEKGRKGQT